MPKTNTCTHLQKMCQIVTSLADLGPQKVEVLGAWGAYGHITALKKGHRLQGCFSS
jgi:hypothetical protein